MGPEVKIFHDIHWVKFYFEKKDFNVNNGHVSTPFKSSDSVASFLLNTWINILLLVFLPCLLSFVLFFPSLCAIVGVSARGARAATQDGVSDHIGTSDDYGTSLAPGDSGRVEVRIQRCGEPLEVGVVRGRGLGEALRNCPARDGEIPGWWQRKVDTIYT